MELEWVLPALDARLNDSGTIDIVGAAIDTLLLSRVTLPVELKLTIAGRVRGPMREWQEAGHSLRLAMRDPAGLTVAHFREPLREIDAPTLLYAGAVPGRLLALPLRWTANSVGSFVLTVQLDEQEPHEFPIAVLQKSDHAGQV